VTDDDARTQYERMVAGDWYEATPDLVRMTNEAQERAHLYADAFRRDADAAQVELRALLGSLGDDTMIRPPLYVDYGVHLHIGSRTFVNFGLVALDVAPIHIGDDVLLGPNVQLLTPVHPVEPGARSAKLESAKPIRIGNNVWLGGGVIVCPGVTIGDNTVVGAGSVVTKDLPANVVAVGNPARVVKEV